MPVHVKICGITRIEDAEAAASAGAWAIGMIHAPGSPRQVDPADAERIGAAMKRHCEVAGVFVNATLDEVVDHAERESLTLVQLHGDEGPSFCAEAARRTGCRVIKAFSVRSSADITASRAYRTDFHLYDAHSAKARGGTGESFDWDFVSRRKGDAIPAILAGGLTPDNVAEAIDAAWPWGVDVASGVEREPGVKDHNKIVSFIEIAKRAGAAQDETRQHRRELRKVRREVERRTSA
jgi:phosphoribosylanthranilate isomerase